MGKIIKTCILAAAIFFASSSSAEVINEILIKGNKRVDSSTIQSLITFHKGDDVTKSDINDTVKKLQDTGMFEEVDLIAQGGVLTVHIVESPRINKIVFEGNKVIKDKDIAIELDSKERGFFSKSRSYIDAAKIKELYQAAGRYLVSVEPKVIRLDDNKVDLIFEITEGAKSKIKKIVFVNNASIAAKTLRSRIVSEETRWYKFLTNNDIFNPDRLEYDSELITRYYQSKGYAAARVVSAISNFSPDDEGFTITFTIDEGKVYKIGSVDVVSALKGLNTVALSENLEVQGGALYNVNLQEEDVDNLTQRINDLGFAFVDVDVDKKFHGDQVNLTYQINEGMKIYLNRINISGNLRTSDEVIRRQFRINEGDPFSQNKIAKSEQLLNDLRYFKKVSINKVPVQASDLATSIGSSKLQRIDLDVVVEEDSTTGLTFGGGFDTHSGVIGQIGFNETNLFGNGQYLDVGFTTSKRNFEGNLGFTEPYFMGRDLSVGFDIFSSKSFKDSSAHTPFSFDSKGAMLRAGYGLTDHLRHSVRYLLDYKKINDVSPYASIFIKKQQSKRMVSAIGQALVYDRTDSAIDPSEGYVLSVDQEVAGVGGNTKYQKYESSARYYKPAIGNTTLVFAFDGGIVRSFSGSKVSVNDAFSLGGENLRGFDFNGVGPRAKKDGNGNMLMPRDGDSLRGKNYYTVKSELKIPLGFQEEFGLHAKLFVDTGSNWGVDLLPGESRSDIYDSTKLRAAAGVGIGFASPFGPISVYYAKPFRKENFDQTRPFGVLFSTKI
jgi:outer membrane protein insertion porin family